MEPFEPSQDLLRDLLYTNSQLLQCVADLMASQAVTNQLLLEVLAGQGHPPAALTAKYAEAVASQRAKNRKALFEIMRAVNLPPPDDTEYWDRPQPDDLPPGAV